MVGKDITVRGSEPSRRLRFNTVALVAGVLVWALAPVAGVAVLAVTSGTSRLAENVDVWAPVRSNETPVRRPISLGLTWSSGYPVVAPNWFGVVQAVSLTPGSTITDGTEVAIIDGIARRAYATDRPFTQQLSQGARGPEVERLHALLNRVLGTALTGDAYTGATGRAVQQFAAAIGVAGTARSFDPGWVVFLGRSPARVAEVSLIPGAPAPSAGQSIIELEPSVVAGMLVEAVVAAPPGPDEVDVADQDDQEDGASSLATVLAEEGERLFIGAVELELSDDRTSVATSSLTQVAELVDADTPLVAASLVREAAPGEFVVPSGAIFATLDQPSCVVVRDGNGMRTARVEVRGDSLGVVVVAGEVRQGDEVLLAPPVNLRRCD